jgi:hypothetical protein
VSPVLFIPRGCISLPVTFGTPENFRTESVLFDVVEVTLPFNAILGRPALYQFMVAAHYRYLVLGCRPPTVSLRSAETARLASLHWKNFRLWLRNMRLQPDQGVRT